MECSSAFWALSSIPWAWSSLYPLGQQLCCLGHSSFFTIVEHICLIQTSSFHFLFLSLLIQAGSVSDNRTSSRTLWVSHMSQGFTSLGKTSLHRSVQIISSLFSASPKMAKGIHEPYACSLQRKVYVTEYLHLLIFPKKLAESCWAIVEPHPWLSLQSTFLTVHLKAASLTKNFPNHQVLVLFCLEFFPRSPFYHILL